MPVFGRPDGHPFFAELEPVAAQFVADNPGMGATHAALAALCELDRDADARGLFAPAAASGFADLSYDALWLTGMLHYARACAHLQNPRAAALLYERLAPWESQLGVGGTIDGSVALYLGLLATTLERFDDANANFAKAHETHQRIEAPYWN